MTGIKFDLPKEYGEELDQLSGDHSSRQWKLAEIAVALIDVYSAPQDPMFPTVVVRNAIADRAGVSSQLIYVYERVARVFPMQVRHSVDPQDILCFEHYRAVLPLGPRGIDYIVKAIETGHEYGGRVAPVRVVAAWASKHQGKRPRDAWAKLLELLQSIAADEHEKPARRKLARKWREDGLGL